MDKGRTLSGKKVRSNRKSRDVVIDGCTGGGLILTDGVGGTGGSRSGGSWTVSFN